MTFSGGTECQTGLPGFRTGLRYPLGAFLRSPISSGAPISLKRNLVATYGSQLYLALIGIVMLPFYLRALGIEAYGMVGLFVVLQSWLALLDFGLSSTLSREAARFRAGAVDAAELRGLSRLIQVLFITVALAVAAVLFIAAPVIVSRWLHNEKLPYAEAVTALRLIGAVTAVRFVFIPLRAFLIGMEDLRWLGIVNSAMTTFRSVLVLAVMALFGANLRIFILWQLAVGLAELLLLAVRARALSPAGVAAPLSFSIFRKYWRFSLGMAAAAAIWIAVTNTDKLILSGLLPLSAYSLFSIATVAAGGVLIVAGPFAIAFGPRLTRFHAAGDTEGVLRLYNQFTQLTGLAAFPLALTLAFFPGHVLWGWTGNMVVARDAATVLALYAMGNGLLAMGGLQIQLQIAAGRLRLYVTGAALFLIIYLPLLWALLRRDGMTGAGEAWLIVNLLFLVVWVAIVHRSFLPGSHMRWLLVQALAVLIPTAGAALLLRLILPWPDNRWLVVAQLAGIGGLLMAIAAASSVSLRGHILATVRGALPRADRN